MNVMMAPSSLLEFPGQPQQHQHEFGNARIEIDQCSMTAGKTFLASFVDAVAQAAKHMDTAGLVVANVDNGIAHGSAVGNLEMRSCIVDDVDD